jgi:hypothetical protein
VYYIKYSLFCQGQSVTILNILRNISMCDCPSNHSIPSHNAYPLWSNCTVTDVVEELSSCHCCCPLYTSIISILSAFVKVNLEEFRYYILFNHIAYSNNP